jgi:hypothetical protein
MFSKIFSSISALLVVVMTIFPASKVEAQGLVEYALILVLVGLNTNEEAEFYWTTNPASPKADPILYGDFDGPTVMYLDVTESADSDCTQSILTPMTDTKPITIAVSHVEYTDGQLVISSSNRDEKITEILDECFVGGRIVLRAGFPIPHNQEDRIFRELASNPNAPVGGMPRLRGGSILDLVSRKTISVLSITRSTIVGNQAVGVD